jgi:hypothetical protein
MTGSAGGPTEAKQRMGATYILRCFSSGKADMMQRNIGRFPEVINYQKNKVWISESYFEIFASRQKCAEKYGRPNITKGK